MGIFSLVFGQVKEWLKLQLHKILRVSHEVAGAITCFIILWGRFARRSVQNYKKRSFVSIFSGLGYFIQAFRQVKEWFILELHEMIRVPHVVACIIVFVFFYGWDWQGGLFKVMENDHFLNIFINVGLFLQMFT